MSLRNRSGITLVELAVVVLIGGLLLAFSLPSLNRYLTGHNLRSGGGILLSEMQLARQRAVTNGSRIWFWYAPGGNTYWVGEQPWQGSGFGGLAWKGPYTLPGRVRIAQVAFGGLNYFIYEPSGRPSAGGSATLVATTGTPDTVQVFLDLSGSVWK